MFNSSIAYKSTRYIGGFKPMELGFIDRSLQGSGMMAENRELPAGSGTNAWNQRFGTVVKSSWKS